jgi:hypothetical protein
MASLSAIAGYRVLEKRPQKKREASYQAALLSFSAALKPGMTRKDVENYLHTRNVTFRLMCCVARKALSEQVYDELVRVGQENAPWFCSEKNIYIAFQFSGHEGPDNNWMSDDSNSLQAVSIYRGLEGCL